MPNRAPSLPYFDATQAQAIVARYLGGESLTKLAASFDSSVIPVKRVLRLGGVTLRPHAETVVTTHACDHHYFDEITDEPRAYWLGFLYADGYVTQGKWGAPILGLTLKRSDVEHVAAFRAALGSTHTLGMGTARIGERTYPTARVSLPSHQLAAALARYGVVPRKSLICVPPELPEHLRRHFWRGVFDGDGSVMQGKTSHESAVVSVCGTCATCEGFAAWVAATTGLSAKVYPNGKIFVIRFSGYSDVSALHGAMYAGATVSLARKRALFEQILERDRARCNAPLCVSGERITRHALARSAGMSPVVLGRRLREGMSVEQAIAMPRTPGRPGPRPLVDVAGERMSQAELARRAGVSRGLVSRRLAAGWSAEDVLSTPAGAKRPTWTRRGAVREIASSALGDHD